MRSQLIGRYILRETLGVVFMGVALFWTAGRMDWWQAWAALAVMLAWIVATAFVIILKYPNLLAERLGPRPGTKSWDKAILSLVGLIQLIRYCIAGLDRRWSWTAEFPLSAQVTALGLCALSYALFIWAIASNPFFSQTVHIQTESGHTVVTRGPYQIVRHPAYAGAILYELVVCILLNSWLALATSGISALLLFLRTILEDRTLQAELAGYRDYARQVRYRLLPGIW